MRKVPSVKRLALGTLAAAALLVPTSSQAASCRVYVDDYGDAGYDEHWICTSDTHICTTSWVYNAATGRTIIYRSTCSKLVKTE